MGEQSDRIRTPAIQSPALRSAGCAVLDLILPLTGFDGGAAQSLGLSSEAWRKITFIADPACDGCGLPFECDTGARRGVCQAHPPAFARGPLAFMTNISATSSCSSNMPTSQSWAGCLPAG